MARINNEAAPAIDRAFLNVLTAHKNGAAISDASAAMKQVVAAVQLTGKPGSLTVNFSIAPATKGDAGTLVIVPKIKFKAPETEAPGSIFYADADFNLVREDPNQKVMDLREPASEVSAAPLKEVGAK